MQLKIVSDFNRILDFQPCRPWPKSLPSIAANGILIAGFQRLPSDTVLDHGKLSSDLFTALFHELHSNLTLPEMSRLSETLKKNNLIQLKDDFLKISGFQPGPNLNSILESLRDVPLELQHWLSEKKMGPQEILPLLNVTPSQAAQILSACRAHRDSRNEASQRMELISDLTLMKYELTDILTQTLATLKSLRYPITSSRDNSLKAKELPWPAKLRAQPKRQGDHSGFDIHFFANSPLELNKLSDQLKKVADAWNSSLDQV